MTHSLLEETSEVSETSEVCRIEGRFGDLKHGAMDQSQDKSHHRCYLSPV